MTRPHTRHWPAGTRSVPLVAALLGLAACGGGPGGPDGGPGFAFPPAPVTYDTVTLADRRIDNEYAGRLHGTREAQVRARVGGILEVRLYTEGEQVEQGAPLFRIEQAPYRIALQRAQAELSNAQAALNQAERESRRIDGLHEQGAISDRERDRALADRELGQARVALAQAGVAQAQLDLQYTTVTAPVGGITGLELLTAGNLVEPGTLLTEVTDLDPIQVRFSMPERDAAARRALTAQAPEDWLAVELLLGDGTRYEHTGTIDFTASTVDPQTGTVSARAVFPNPHQRLRPGTLARVRLAIDRLPDAAVVDPVAVVQGPAGTIVFVLADENMVRARAVRLGPITGDGQLVLEGLAAGDRVIVNGQVALGDGAPVMAQPRDAGSR
jgi:membrane fusion protein, multidrug efflux system